MKFWHCFRSETENPMETYCELKKNSCIAKTKKYESNNCSCVLKQKYESNTIPVRTTEQKQQQLEVLEHALRKRIA